MLDHYYWKSSPDISQIEFDPKLRKATLMMKLLVEGLKPLFKKLENSSFDKGSIQTFLGSLHGEIEPTHSFLKSFAQRDWARPFLFQNSLHHSTTGFASQQFALLGPSYSICVIGEAQKEILTAGLIQLLSSQRPTLLIHVEHFPEELAALSPYKVETSCEILFLGPTCVEGLNARSGSKGDFNSINSFSQLNTILNESGKVRFAIDQCRIPFETSKPDVVESI